MRAHNYFMKLAREARAVSSSHFWRSGAVIVKDGLVVSTGHSEIVLDDRPRCISRPLSIPQAEDCATCNFIDASANAIALAAGTGVKLEGANLYTTMAPCLSSIHLIAQAGIKAIYFEQDYELDTSARRAFWDNIKKEMEFESCELICSFEAE